ATAPKTKDQTVFNKVTLASFLFFFGSATIQAEQSLPFIPWPQGPQNAWRWEQGKLSDPKGGLGIERALNPEENSEFTSDHPVVKRIQYWIDRLHFKLAQKDPESFKNIPKPIVRLYRDQRRRVGARVQSLAVCHNIPAKLSSGENVKQRKVNFGLFMHGVQF